MHFHLLTAFMLIAFVSYVHCGCDKSSEDSEEGDVTHFFKNLGCDIKKGADKISDAAKPWIDEAGKTAKKFGGTVADTFTDIKQKITGPSDNNTSSTTTTVAPPASSSGSSLLPASIQEPDSLDDRVLLDTPKICPDGQKDDGRGHCRSIA